VDLRGWWTLVAEIVVVILVIAADRELEIGRPAEDVRRKATMCGGQCSQESGRDDTCPDSQLHAFEPTIARRGRRPQAPE
jgi:hypothetical protein